MGAEIAILGGGISGVALAANLRKSWTLFEAAPRLGGLCASLQEDGFTFDLVGPHILFSKNREVLEDMVAALRPNVGQGRRDNKIWFRGCFVKYPFENGLGDLPKDALYECILGYLQNPWKGEPKNLAEWSYKTFGEGISNLYFLPYNRKIWNHDPAEIALEWVSRIPKPPMEDVLKSAIGIPTEGYLHQLHFYYPITGGIEALVDGYARRATSGTLHTDAPVLRLTRLTGGWEVETPLGVTRHDQVVNTIPIHELAKVWTNCPAEVNELLGQLQFNSLLNVLIGVAEDRGYPYTALYVPDTEAPFHRVSFPKAFSPDCVPAGMTSMMAEITCREGDAEWAKTDEEIVDGTVGHLARMGLLDPGSVIYRKVARTRYAYPIYDLAYFETVKALRAAVAAEGLHLLGRFAEFDYINSDTCVERAIAMAGLLGGQE